MKKKLTIQQRLILPIILLGAVAILSNALSVFGINNVNFNASKIVDNYMVGSETLQNIRHTTTNIHKMALSHIVATDYNTMITVVADIKEEEKILDYELWVYCMEEPRYLGRQQEFILSPRLDNLTSVQALLTGLTESRPARGLNVVALFDHEEVGCYTKQGAGSMMLLNLLEKIHDSQGKSAAQTRESLYDAFLLSLDVAHGLHPNQMGKMDITNKPVLGKGLCIKEASPMPQTVRRWQLWNRFAGEIKFLIRNL